MIYSVEFMPGGIMMKNVITFAICGFGDRGSTYASMANLFPDRMKVVAVADTDPLKVEKARKLYNIPEENCFNSDEELFAADRVADVVCICTMDRQHVDEAIMAINKGYHIVLEKPISPELSKCEELLKAAKGSGSKIVVCHVLRYTVFYNKIKELISSGEIGDVVAVTALENVGYWHQAHSFVRGNWRNSETASPMILQKSCHDMDILHWVTGKKCKSVSSIGSNTFFNEKHAPEGSAEYCLQGCKAKAVCKFDAEKIYLKNPKTGREHGKLYPSSVLTTENTLESTRGVLQNGQYGRCVFRCDNNVVDHQQTNLLMEDGTTISFTMCAFTEDCYREFKAMGTEGEITADLRSNQIHITGFGEGTRTIDIGAIASDLKGHGGGDSGIISDFLDMLENGSEPNDRTTTLEASMESHYMAIAAELSRVKGGKSIEIEDLKKNRI